MTPQGHSDLEQQSHLQLKKEIPPMAALFVFDSESRHKYLYFPFGVVLASPSHTRNSTDICDHTPDKASSEVDVEQAVFPCATWSALTS